MIFGTLFVFVLDGNFHTKCEVSFTSSTSAALVCPSSLRIPEKVINGSCAASHPVYTCFLHLFHPAEHTNLRLIT